MPDHIIKYRRLIIFVAIAITVLAGLMLPRLEVDPDLENYVPEHLENKAYLKKLNSIFGSTEMILVMLHSDDVVKAQTLEHLRTLSKEICQLEGISSCVSPFDAKEISYDDGFMLMDPLIQEEVLDELDMVSLKSRILANPMASRFFSEDFTLVSLILTKDTDAPDAVIEEIQAVIDQHPGDEEVLIGGLPYIKYSISGNIKSDMKILVPLALLLMVGMLYFFFREWKGVYMPFIVVAMSIVISFGVMALLGWQISLISILMPIMLIAIANDYGIHLISRYQELARSNESMSMIEMSKQIYVELRRPIIITGLTTIAGILGLLTHTMIPAAQLGVLTSVGIGVALILSIWFLPAMLSYSKLPKPAVVARQKRISWTDRWLNRFSRWVSYHPRLIVAITIFIAVSGTMGVFLIEVDTNIEGYFLGKSEVRRSTEIINKQFGGAQFISILFEGDVLLPEVLHHMESYEEEIRKDPAVGNVNSPVTLVKELSKGFYLPHEEGYNQIPESADEAFQLIEIFAMGGNDEAVEQFIDYKFEHARILISLKDGSNSAGKDLLVRLKEMTGEDPDVLFITGSALTKIELADMVVTGQIKSLIFAMVMIFLLISVIFRSPKAGILSSLPLSIAIIVLFGLMGILGISLDIATALLSSIMIGVGIDYTIHFLWRFRMERIAGLDHKEAASVTLSTAGRGIFFNAVSVVIGFLALSLSSFAPMRYFSALIVLSITICLISALLLVPAIVVLTKPRFLDR